MQPRLALSVANLGKSILFYVERMGFTFDEMLAADIVQIIDPDGEPFLLVTPQAQKVTDHMAEQHFLLRPGESITFGTKALDSIYAELKKRGVENLQLGQTRVGDRKLEIVDPDGYILRFIESTRLAPQQYFDLYLRCVHELERVLAGITESEEHRSKTPGSWTIRQIVHHLADSETLFVWWMKFALVESGRVYVPNWPSGNDIRDEVFKSLHRDISTSVALFKATRLHIAQIVQRIPDPWERYTEDNDGKRTTFLQLVTLQTQHAMEHIEEINAARNNRR